jgi:Golgi SNAP receptor complex protein 2
VSPNICEMQTFMNTLAYRRRIEEAERADLLSRSDANGGRGWRANMDDDAQAMGYVQNSKRALEEAFQTGTAILTNMAGQRERLKVSL